MTKTTSLKKNCEFQHVFQMGKTKGSGILVVFVAPNELNVNRLGIPVSKKMGKAVRRNLLRRRIKEAFRAFEQNLVGGHDIVILPKPDLATASFAETKKTLMYLMKRHGIVNG